MKHAHSDAFPASHVPRHRTTALDRWALHRIHHALTPAPVRLTLWDGFEIPSSGGAVAAIDVKTRRALFEWLWDPDLRFGDAYMAGAIEVRGDLVRLLEEVYRVVPAPNLRPWWLRRANGVSTAKDNVHRHYDLGNPFYRLWLDREMVYTCAFFPAPDCTLEDAQITKMDRVCRKLRLRPGERVIEVGCGWGAQALFMARHYGVTVRAYNVSAEQIAYARDRANAEGLTDRVEFIEDDYRNARGECDAFVSVGMLEHVGLDDYPTLGRVIDRALTPRGRGLLHFIGRNRPAPLNAWIRKRIFPGAYPPTLREVFERVLEPAAFSVVDVENLRLHYAKTIDHWTRRFKAGSREIAAMFDEPFVRAWRLYLAGSQAAFTTGWMQLFQVVFARNATDALPWIRPS